MCYNLEKEWEYEKNNHSITAVSKDNVRTTLTIPKDLKNQLEQLAKEQNRSLNNLILTLIKKSLNEK